VSRRTMEHSGVPGDQLLPAKSDSFFTLGLSIEERFVRDRGGRVSGIVYTMGDTEIEAKRVP